MAKEYNKNLHINNIPDKKKPTILPKEVRLGKIQTQKVEGAYCSCCDKAYPKDQLMETDEEGYTCCEKCAEELTAEREFEDDIIYCRNCKNEVEEEGDFCCKTCIDEYKWDNYREKF